jgi:hypothetical protein
VPIASCKSLLPPSPIDEDEVDDKEDLKSYALYMSMFVSLNNELFE